MECGLCPRRCFIAPGKAGKCRVRFNRGGKLEIPFYGFITALAVDPIEKKPLYHFRPGTDILSAGFAGCNLHCPFCQNWHISQNTNAGGRFLSPPELIAAAQEVKPKNPNEKSAGQKAVNPAAAQISQSAIAYTYSEPLVHIEYLLDCMREARRAGIANVLVSNGCVNSDAAVEILELTDAANIDLKCFSEETYKNVLGGDLSTVLGFIQTAAEKGVHLELTTLVVPGLNDSREELDRCRDFIAELRTNRDVIPWHLSAYHPGWKWKARATESFFLAAAVKRAREKLTFVYSGNVSEEENFNNTVCPRCGKTLIERRGFRADSAGLSLKTENGRLTYFCVSCGKKAPVKW